MLRSRPLNLTTINEAPSASLYSKSLVSVISLLSFITLPTSLKILWNLFMCCRKKVRLAACTASTEGCLCWSASIFAWARTSQFRLLLDNQLQTHLLPLPIKLQLSLKPVILPHIARINPIIALFAVSAYIQDRVDVPDSGILFSEGTAAWEAGLWTVPVNVHFLLRPTAKQSSLGFSLSLSAMNTPSGANEQRPDLQLPTSTSNMRYFYIST